MERTGRKEKTDAKKSVYVRARSELDMEGLKERKKIMRRGMRRNEDLIG